MSRFVVAILCFFGISAVVARAQNSTIQPLRFTAGSVLTFHLQTLMRPATGDPLAVLAEGTVLQVRLLDSIDSRVNHDGDVFHGSIVSPVRSADKIAIQAGAGVQGLLVLLRSKNHPEGFRYELLITSLTDFGRVYAVTASLDPSLFDASAQHARGAITGPKTDSAGHNSSHGQPRENNRE